MDVERCSGTIISMPFGKHKIDALYYQLSKQDAHAGDTPVILRLHGILGNLLDETEHALPHFLATQGYSSLTINTVLANLGLFYGFGIIDDAMPQIDAACDFLERLGFKHIVIAGHGLGGCMAIRYAASRRDRSQRFQLRGVIAISTTYSLPELVQRRWETFRSEPSYEDVYRRAKRLFHPEPGSDPASDETVVVKRAHGPSTLPHHTEIYTLRTWWALAGPEAEGAKPYLHIGEVAVPILLVQGAKDDMIEPREAEELGAIAMTAGNQDVTRVILDAGHTLEGKHDELGNTIVTWLGTRC